MSAPWVEWQQLIEYASVKARQGGSPPSFIKQGGRAPLPGLDSERVEYMQRLLGSVDCLMGPVSEDRFLADLTPDRRAACIAATVHMRG